MGVHLQLLLNIVFFALFVLTIVVGISKSFEADGVGEGIGMGCAFVLLLIALYVAYAFIGFMLH